MTPQPSLESYTFHRPQLFNLLFDELGQTVLRIHNEQFQGTRLADTTEYKPDQPISFSNIRVLSYNRILHQQTNGRIQVASPKDVVRSWERDIPEINITYADTDSIALFSPKGDNSDLAQRVFEILGKTETAVPLLVAGLKPVRAGNDHGFTFEATEHLTATAAPYLKKDGRVRYDPATDSLVEAKNDEEGVHIWIPSNQSGLRGACRDGGFLCFRGDRLLDSNADGRVQVVERDPKGRAA